MHVMAAKQALDRHYLEARCLLLDLAAILDRIDRGGKIDDPRLKQFAQALQVLQDGGPDRAEKVQHIFSLPYEPDWPRPTPSE